MGVILLVSGHRGKNWHPRTNNEHGDALRWLEAMIKTWLSPDQVWHGGATGVDAEAHRLAVMYQRDIHVFSARWDRDGNRAGPIRNERMAVAAEKAMASGRRVYWAIMPGGNGTAHAHARAKHYEIPCLLAGQPPPGG